MEKRDHPAPGSGRDHGEVEDHAANAVGRHHLAAVGAGGRARCQHRGGGAWFRLGSERARR
eukprot:1942206-Pyramimonas_sp.AAC.1